MSGEVSRPAAGPATGAGEESKLPFVASYAALGDSFTAGTGCPPGARWPDRIAQALRETNRDIVYKNFAEKGATTSQLLASQVPRANQLEPALLTVLCGTNDILESVRPDVDAAAARLGEAFDRLQDAVPGAIVLSATIPERWHFLALGQRTRRRVQDGIHELNARIRELVIERDVPFLETAGHQHLDNPDNFSSDGLHPSIVGHRKAAEEFIALLGRELPARLGGGGSV